jgi:hypothetical protein
MVGRGLYYIEFSRLNWVPPPPFPPPQANGSPPPRTKAILAIGVRHPFYRSYFPAKFLSSSYLRMDRAVLAILAIGVRHLRTDDVQYIL